MPYHVWTDLIVDELYLAGEWVAAGLYREIVTGREIHFDTEDYLPATNDGRVAAYACVRYTWGQRQEAQKTACPTPIERSLPVQPSFDRMKRKAIVLLASDHLFWCDGVRRMVKNTEFEILGDAPSWPKALASALMAQPDIMLLDMRITGGDGIEQLSTLKEECPRIAVILLTATADPSFMVRAASEGAAGCLHKGAGYKELLNSLRTITCNTVVVTECNLPQAAMDLSCS